MGTQTFRLRLYITAEARNSLLAIANLRNLFEEHLREPYELEIVDLTLDPQRALRDSIYMTPTLVRLEPAPELRLVGTLGRPEAILAGLGIQRPLSL